MKIRSNASLEATARGAAKQSRFLYRKWGSQSDSLQEQGIHPYERATLTRDSWDHWKDVQELAKHLCRLADIDEDLGGAA